MYRNLSTQALGFLAPQNEQIEMALSYGFRGMDLDLVDYAQQVEARGEKMARRLIDSAGIKLGCFRLPVDLEADETKFKSQVARLGGMVQYAAQLGITIGQTFIQPASNELPMHENFERHRARLLEIGNVLGAAGLRLAVGYNAVASARQGKSFEFIYTFDAMCKLLEAVNSPHVGHSLDLWQNYICSAGIDQWQGLGPEKIFAVRVSSAPANVAAAELDEQHRLIPSLEGPIRLVDAINALKAMNYQGPVTPVVHRSVLAGKRRDEIVRVVGRAMSELWHAAGLGPLLTFNIGEVASNGAHEVEEAPEPEESSAN